MKLLLRPFVICGPSGSGKSTLLERLMNEFPNSFAYSVSHTTRRPRAGEKDGVDYYFVSRDEMLRRIGDGEFIEHAEFSGNIYGTSKRAVQDVLKSGRICVLMVDIQGVTSLKKTDLDPICCFIKTSNFKSLKERLNKRGTESEESLAKRLETAKRELEYEKAESNMFDHVIVNDDLDTAYGALKTVLKDQLAYLESSWTQKLQKS